MESSDCSRDKIFLNPFKAGLLALILSVLPSCQSGKESSKPPVRVSPEVRQLARDVLAPLGGPVTLRIFRGGEGEIMGDEAQALVDLLAQVSPHVTVSRVDISAQTSSIDPDLSHGPVIEMEGRAPGTLRYYGYPERRETRPFLEGVLTASGHPAELAPDIRSFLTGLKEEVLIRIFTTPD